MVRTCSADGVLATSTPGVDSDSLEYYVNQTAYSLSAAVLALNNLSQGLALAPTNTAIPEK